MRQVPDLRQKHSSRYVDIPEIRLPIEKKSPEVTPVGQL